MGPGIPVIYRKALRDLWQLRSQALAIVGVVMAGIAMLTMLQIAFHSLLASRDHLFSAAQGNLPDVWVSLKRAPEAVARQVAALPGVAQVQTRIMASGKLALAGVDEPLQTQLVSLPDDGRQPLQNRLFLQAGRRPAPWSRDEVVISEAFAAVHHLQPGARLQVTVNGRTQGFRVVGVGGSPEFLYQLAPGSVFPDHAHFAVLWVPRSTLAAAMNMKGAFNALSATLSRQGAAPGHEADVLAAIDHVLDRWGGLGAIGRDEQISTRRLRDELAQLQINVRLLPTVFLAVAAFLLHVVFTRLVGLQRGQIAILKAFGYRTSTVVLHYALMAATICVTGALLGVLAGSGMGHWLAVTYQHNFRFPSLHHAVDLKTVLTGVAVAVLAGMAGASQAVLRAVREPVAQAMRPQPPERYRIAGIGQGGLARYLPQPARMVLRHLARHPGRALLTVAGLAMVGGLVVMVRLQPGALTFLVDSRFRLGELYDVSVRFTEAQPHRALFELQSLPGVQQAEGMRAVPVELLATNHRLRTVLEGMPGRGELRGLIDGRLERQPLPENGLLMNAHVARRLGVSVGDRVSLRELQGRRRTLQLPVAAVINELLGVTVYMNVAAFGQVLGDGDVLEGAVLDVLPGELQTVRRALDRRPDIASVTVRQEATDSFYQVVRRISVPITSMGIVLAMLVNFGVVYNAARITLAERMRELASLRVLGFTRSEVAHILMGEIGLLVLLSIPLSFACGWGLGWLMVQGMQNDLYRVPLTLPPEGYALAALVTLTSTLVSMAAVLRLMNRMDMLAVLQNRV